MNKLIEYSANFPRTKAFNANRRGHGEISELEKLDSTKFLMDKCRRVLNISFIFYCNFHTSNWGHWEIFFFNIFFTVCNTFIIPFEILARVDTLNLLYVSQNLSFMIAITFYHYILYMCYNTMSKKKIFFSIFFSFLADIL